MRKHPPGRRVRLPLDRIAERYEAGESAQQIAEAFRVHPGTILNRLREMGVTIRPTGTARPSNRHWWLDTQEIVQLWNAGHTAAEIADRFKVSKFTIYARLKEAQGGPFEAINNRIYSLYVEEELSCAEVAEKLRMAKRNVRSRLNAMGISPRVGGRPKKRYVADTDSVKAIRSAVRARRWEQQPVHENLGPRQCDVVDVLFASPEPLTASQIIDVLRGLPRSWSSLGIPSVHDALRRLRKRDLVDKIEVVDRNEHRGSKRVLWFPRPTESAADINAIRRDREIEALREQQTRETNQIGWDNVSLDAKHGDSGRALIDSLGTTDPRFEEITD